MSRSNPNVNGTPNPSTRWFEWNGEAGTVRYYDKDKKENVDCGSDFTFILLDELGGVGGWHEASKSGIYSNEVKDTRTDVLIVKAFKGGTLVEGLYKDIKDKAHSAGGQFVSNCYIAFKQGEALALGSLKFKGAALGTWMEFRKAHRSELYSKAVKISGFTEGKKGRIVYRMPKFSTNDISAETNKAAIALDETLQAFLAEYFKRRKRDQVDDTAQSAPPDSEVDHSAPLTDEDIPF